MGISTDISEIFYYHLRSIREKVKNWNTKIIGSNLKPSIFEDSPLSRTTNILLSS